MDFKFEKGTVILFGKSTKLDTLIKKFTQLSGEQVYHFLINRGIQLPRKMNCMALISVLNKRIKKLNSNSLAKDYFARLQYYKYFTEQQLFALFTKICNDENAFLEYRYNLFNLILTNFVALDLNDGELVYVKNLKKQTTESFPQYFNYISGACLEQTNTFDGQDIDILKDKLVDSASNQDLYDMAGKYGIDINQRLKREEYEEFIFDYMKANNTYNEELAEEIRQMNITQLTTFCNRVDIPMHPNMNKQEIVTYLFYFLEKCTMDYTSVKRIETPKNYEPLEFSVDLKVVSNFGRNEPKKVIYYNEAEDNEADDFNLVLDPTDDDVIDEEVKANYKKEQEELQEAEAKKKNPTDLEILAKAKEEKENDDPLIFERENPEPGIVEETKDDNVLDSSIIGDPDSESNEDNETIEPTIDETTIEENKEEVLSNDLEATEEVINEESLPEEIEVSPELEEQIVYVDEDGNIIDPSTLEHDGVSFDSNEEPQEEIKEEKDTFDVSKITINDEYNSKKIQNVGKSKVPLISTCVVLGIMGVIALYIFIAFFV